MGELRAQDYSSPNIACADVIACAYCRRHCLWLLLTSLLVLTDADVINYCCN